MKFTEFNPIGLEYGELTNSDLLDPAMRITNELDAEHYFEEYVKYLCAYYHINKAEAEKNAKENLGYWAAYFSHKVVDRVELLFDAPHPLFSKIKPTLSQVLDGWTRPTPSQIFQLGLKMGKEAKEKKENEIRDLHRRVTEQ